MIVLKAAQAQILEALQSVAGIVERRHTLPILANVLMRKTGDQVEFTTSDLEIQVRTQATLGGDAGNHPPGDLQAEVCDPSRGVDRSNVFPRRLQKAEPATGI